MRLQWVDKNLIIPRISKTRLQQEFKAPDLYGPVFFFKEFDRPGNDYNNSFSKTGATTWKQIATLRAVDGLYNLPHNNRDYHL